MTISFPADDWTSRDRVLQAAEAQLQLDDLSVHRCAEGWKVMHAPSGMVWKVSSPAAGEDTCDGFRFEAVDLRRPYLQTVAV